MKVGVAVWKGRISPVFDVSRNLVVLDVHKDNIRNRQQTTLPDEDPVSRAGRLAALKIETLICGAISRSMTGMLAAKGIRTLPFVAGEVEEVITAYITGHLPNPALTMPGRGQGRRRRFRHGCRR